MQAFLLLSETTIYEPPVLPSWLKSIKTSPKGLLFMDGGSERIRTSGTVARSHAFQACSLNHSDTLPSGSYYSTLEID